MEFPITRERLKNYLINEAVVVERKQRLEKVIQNICAIVGDIVISSRDTRLIYLIDTDIRGTSKPLHYKLPQPTSILDEVMAKLKELFLDCIVQVDPLKTYILIDWS